MNIALQHALTAEAERVTEIHITLGQLSSIVDDSVQFYWDMISEKTICQGAVLQFTRVPARLACQVCGHEFGIENGLEPCPSCGSYQVKVIAGEEFWLDSIVVEKGQEISQ